MPTWADDPELGGEAVFAHVGAGLLLGDGLLRSPDGGPTVQRVGRNLLTEAEHATSLRHARDIMAEAHTERPDDADGQAQHAGDPAGVAYLRDNADELITSLATRQAKAAQELLDSYGTMGRLALDRKQLASMVPQGKRVEQAQWLTYARSAAGQALDAAPDAVSGPLRERLAELGSGNKPEQWFERASDLSDALTRAKAKATRSGDTEQAGALDAAQRTLRAGLSDETLWGAAAGTETQRATGYERRVIDHLGAFEAAFASDGKADPDAFARLLRDDDPDAAEALRGTLESARATAGAASRFGRGQDAQRILAAADALEGTGAQGRAIRAARGGGAAQDPEAVQQSALEALGGAPGDPDSAVRDGVMRAVDGFVRSSESLSRRAAADMLRPRGRDQKSSPAVLQIAAPGAPSVTMQNFDGVRSHLDKMAGDPRYFAEVLGASFGRLPEVAPEVYSAITVQAAKTVNYLVAVAPGGKSGGPFAQQVPVSDDELWDFNQRFAAATDPEFVRSELRQGQLSSQSIEAYQVVHERQYLRLQMDVFARLQEMHEVGIPVPSAAREQLDVLLDLDGGGDPAMTWQVAERAEAGAQQHKQRLAMKQGQNGNASAMQSQALNTLSNPRT